MVTAVDVAWRNNERKTQRRLESQAVSAYLAAIAENGPSIPDADKRMAEIEDAITRHRSEGNWLKVLDWTQKRVEAEATVALADLQAEFIKVAASYSTRKGIEYRAWRELGVPATVLAQAGVTKTPGKDQ